MTRQIIVAANDNPGGSTETDVAIEGLVRLLAQAYARKGAASSAANTDRAPSGIAANNKETR